MEIPLSRRAWIIEKEFFARDLSDAMEGSERLTAFVQSLEHLDATELNFLASQLQDYRDAVIVHLLT